MKNTLRVLGFGLLTLGVVQGAVAQTPPPTTVKFEAAKLAGGTSETFRTDAKNTLKSNTLWHGTRLNAAMAIATACADHNKAATLTEEGLKCVAKKFFDLADRDVKVHANQNPACSMEVSKDDCNCTVVPKIIIGPQAPKTAAAVIDEISALVNILAE